MVHLLHKYIQDRNYEPNLNLFESVYPQTCNNTKGDKLLVQMCLHICVMNHGKHLWDVNESSILIHNISITRSGDTHTSNAEVHRQARSEIWIHQDFSGKDRSSSMRSVAIKILFPLVKFSDQIPMESTWVQVLFVNWAIASVRNLKLSELTFAISFWTHLMSTQTGALTLHYLL